MLHKNKAVLAALTPLLNELTLVHNECMSQQQTLEQALRHTPPLEPLHEATLRAEELAEVEAAYRAAQKALNAVEGPWRHPIDYWKASSKLKRVNALRQKKIASVAAPESVVARQNEIDARNRQIAATEKTRTGLIAKISAASACIKQIGHLKDALQALSEHAARGAWIPSPSHDDLGHIHALCRQGKLGEATSVADALVYQRVPVETTFTQWTLEATDILSKAKDRGAGFSATTAHAGIANLSIDLALENCHPGVRQDVDEDEASWDRWPHLASLLCAPRAFRHDIHWALYWAAFQAAQRFAQNIDQAQAHEDVHTGAFLESLRTIMPSWAGSRIDQMGYPDAKAYLGTLSSAGNRLEPLMGADIAIIVDIGVGDLILRKVALLQAKVSNNGTADVGSKPTGPQSLTQLQKLRNETRDYHLFYHRGVRNGTSIVPTVTRVADFVQKLKWDEAARKKEHLQVKTREFGWDWASFFAFGLCSNVNNVGLMLKPDEDAFKALLSDRDRLPNYLLVVSISDKTNEYELGQKVRAHYREIGTAMAHNVKNRPRGLGIQSDGYDHSM